MSRSEPEVTPDPTRTSVPPMREMRSTSGWFAGLLGLKTLLIASLLVVLAATNIAALLSSGVHDLLYAGLRKVLLIGGDVFADQVTRRSPKRATEETVRMATTDLSDRNRALLERETRLSATNDKLKARQVQMTAEVEGMQAENKRVNAQLVDLESRHAKTIAELDRLQAEHEKLNAAFRDREAKFAADKRTAKEMATSVNRRLAKGVARNTAAIPAESLPYVGIGVTLSVTALDIYDACQTMEEINGLMLLLGQGQESADYCGTKLPTTTEIVETLTKTWAVSMEGVVKEVKRVPSGIALPPIPDVRLPTATEAKSVICQVFGGMSWLAC